VLACADRAEAHWCEAQSGAREGGLAIRLRGLGHRSAKDYAAAIAAFREAVELWRTLEQESEDVAIGLNDLAGIERLSGDLDRAERDYREVLRIARDVDYREGIAIYTGNLGGLALHRKEWSAGEVLARQALPLSEKIGRQELALPHARRAVEIYTRLGSPDLVVACEILAQCES